MWLELRFNITGYTRFTPLYGLMICSLNLEATEFHSWATIGILISHFCKKAILNMISASMIQIFSREVISTNTSKSNMPSWPKMAPLAFKLPHYSRKSLRRRIAPAYGTLISARRDFHFHISLNSTGKRAYPGVGFVN